MNKSLTFPKIYAIIIIIMRKEIFMIIILSILISIPMAILGAHIGLWLADNFSMKKIITIFKRKETPKYLL